MLTRSHGPSNSQHESRKSLPPVLTRNRKRKSSALQDDDVASRVSDVSSQSHRSRLSVSSGELHKIPFTHLFPTNEIMPDERKIAISKSRRSRHSTPSNGSSSAKSYRRNLIEHDYDTQSTTSSTTTSSLFSTSSGSGASYPTRRSSRSIRSRSSHSDEESIVSGVSSLVEVGPGNEEVTPQSKYGLRSSKGESSNARSCCLPSVCFANSVEIWDLMCKMDLKYKRNPTVFENHPALGPQMRAILLDWIMDVCEAYKLHRETLYLAIDYLDRYLAVQKNVPKAHLQLIGITCLFVASKLEEIYPPKLKTFAYVTDGACSESEILDMELVLTKTLKWKLTPITPATWVNIYLQILAYRSGGPICTRSGSDFLKASLRDYREGKTTDTPLIKHLYDRVDYVKVIRLVDLAILDAQSLKFTYSILSAAAIYHTKGRRAALAASGCQWEQLAACVNWMGPAATVIKRYEVPTVLPSIDDVTDESRHLIQAHNISLDMLGESEALTTNKICSPLATEGVLTPPSSGDRGGLHHRKSGKQSRF